MPAEHVAPPPQEMPQPPQLLVSVCSLTQEPLQPVRPDVQQTGVAPALQLPDVQSALMPHPIPTAQVFPAASHVVPPQSVPVSAPFCTVSVHVAAWHFSGAPLQM